MKANEIQSTPTGRLKRPGRSASERAKRRIAEQVRAAGGTPMLADKPADQCAIQQDDRITDVMLWYIKGCKNPSELAQATGLTEAKIVQRYLPAVDRRLARGLDRDELDERLDEALVREQGMLRYAWSEMNKATHPEQKAEWAMVIEIVHANIARLHGLHGVQRDAEAYSLAVGELLSAVTALVDSTGDSGLMERYSHILENFTAGGARLIIGRVVRDVGVRDVVSSA